MPEIKLEHVSLKLSAGGFFKRREVLSDLSFTLQNQNRLALIGPNGSGKSTLLRTIAGILSPSAGSIQIEGRVSALFNLGLGTRRQSSGRRNMVIRNLIEGHSMHDIRARLPEMVEFADIGEFIDLPLEIYSQGMAMRTVFSAATVFDPEILLMDEWVGAGDMAFRKKSEQRMHELVDLSGIIVIASHHKRLTSEICDLGLYLKDGKSLFFGDVSEAWERYEFDSR